MTAHSASDAEATPVLIVIPSYDRENLLDRTLRSLADCQLPANLRRIVVVENGDRLGAEQTVARFKERLPIDYVFSPPANKSRALNEALRGANDEFVIFYDDDVRIHAENAVAFLRALGGRKQGTFLGGRCLVDYEEEPPAWLLGYIPDSAKGWSLGSSFCELKLPQALGFNWAAFAADIHAVGGFNEDRGPGTLARGQESDMQRRLLAAGVRGYFVPDAQVWHYVPRERCSPDWALRRARQSATLHGTTIANLPLVQRLARTTASRLKGHAFGAALTLFSPFLPEQKRFHYRYWQIRCYGFCAGVRLERKKSTSGSA